MKVFKNWVTSHLLIATLFLMALLAFTTGCAKKEAGEIRIGAVLPLTGSIAQYGQFMKQGIELALEDAVRDGLIPTGRIKLIIEDAQADPRKSVDAFRKLMTSDRISAVIPATSGVTLAIKPIANKNAIVIINASAISTDIEDSVDFCFSVLPNAKFEGRFLADLAFNKLSATTAGVLYRNDASGKSFQEHFAARFKENGGTVNFVEWHEPETKDFRSYLAKLRGAKEIDVLFVASWGPEVALFARQAREQGIHVQILAYETFNSPRVLEIAGGAANGVIFCASTYDPFSQEPLVAEFVQRVRQRFRQEEVNYYIASHYDAMILLIKAVAAGATNGTEIMNFLTNLKDYKGITGEMTFDEKGAVSQDLGVYTVREGLFVQYQTE